MIILAAMNFKKFTAYYTSEMFSPELNNQKLGVLYMTDYGSK